MTKISPDASLIAADTRGGPGALSATEANGLVFPCGAPPEPGEAKEVAPGVYWTRVGLPMQGLDHINLYLLRTETGWIAVDTGIKQEASYEHWKALHRGVMGERPVEAVVVTHMHPDHVGLAGWLSRRFDCPLYMSRLEYVTCRMLVGDTGREAPPEGIDFFRRAGWDDDALEKYRIRFGFFGQMISRLPDAYARLSDGQTLTFGSQRWRVITANGHSPEHACLHSEAHKVLISGDQVLPGISSNVSVHPTEPDADPLADWLDSCAKLKREVPDDVLVLPAHNDPFHGLHARLDQLVDKHHRALARLKLLLATGPKTTPECFPALFKRTITSSGLGLATGETIAHLNYLIHDHTAPVGDRVVAELGEDGRMRYRFATEPDEAALARWRRESQP